MKVGFIVECGPEGAETRVIPYLAQLVDGTIEPDVIPLDRKPRLKQECGRWAKALLEQGCQRVLILWDLLPDWGEFEGCGCRHVDKEHITESLSNAGFDPADPRIHLICVEKMIEAWLLADNRAVKNFIETDAHPIRVRRYNAPDTVRDPKATLNGVFKKSRLRAYVDRDHAIGIARKVTDLTRLRRSASFARFEEKLTI